MNAVAVLRSGARCTVMRRAPGCADTKSLACSVL